MCMSDIEIERSVVPRITVAQWARLERLLVPGAVLESAWLQSAAGIRRDCALSLMSELARAGGCDVSLNVHHDCCEHTVQRVRSADELVSPWECPECEEVEDIGSAATGIANIGLDYHMVLTKPVRFV